MDLAPGFAVFAPLPRGAEGRLLTTDSIDSSSCSPLSPSLARTGKGSIKRQAGNEANKLPSRISPRTSHST
jgi:hypothetical protein